jgi:hypothetical protein
LNISILSESARFEKVEGKMFGDLRNGIDTRIRLEKKYQIDRLAKEMSNIESSPYGSEFEADVTELCCLAVRSRGQFIWRIIWRYITTAGVSYSADLQKELTNMFAECFKNIDDINEQMKSIRLLPVRHTPQVTPWMVENVNQTHADTIDEINAEIGLFIISLKKKEAKEEAPPTVMNFYSPVGAVQTGPSATANITQNIDTEAKAAINAAFDMIITRLSEINELQQETELIELAEDGKMELSKSKPNALKIQNYILTIGTMIQTTAALKPAYELLKQGAAYLGFSLP